MGVGAFTPLYPPLPHYIIVELPAFYAAKDVNARGDWHQIDRIYKKNTAK